MKHYSAPHSTVVSTRAQPTTPKHTVTPNQEQGVEKSGESKLTLFPCWRVVIGLCATMPTETTALKDQRGVVWARVWCKRREGRGWCKPLHRCPKTPPSAAARSSRPRGGINSYYKGQAKESARIAHRPVLRPQPPRSGSAGKVGAFQGVPGSAVEYCQVLQPLEDRY
jgi:hypothetical protein